MWGPTKEQLIKEIVGELRKVKSLEELYEHASWLGVYDKQGSRVDASSKQEMIKKIVKELKKTEYADIEKFKEHLIYERNKGVKVGKDLWIRKDGRLVDASPHRLKRSGSELWGLGTSNIDRMD
jgi:hypothetical protein